MNNSFSNLQQTVVLLAKYYWDRQTFQAFGVRLLTEHARHFTGQYDWLIYKGPIVVEQVVEEDMVWGHRVQTWRTLPRRLFFYRYNNNTDFIF